MDWGEKLIWVALGLVLISCGLVILDVHSVLMAHLTISNWMMIGFTDLAVLLVLAGGYLNTPKATRARTQILLAIVFVMMSWTESLVLMGKIAR